MARGKVPLVQAAVLEATALRTTTCTCLVSQKNLQRKFKECWVIISNRTNKDRPTLKFGMVGTRLGETIGNTARHSSDQPNAYYPNTAIFDPRFFLTFINVEESV